MAIDYTVKFTDLIMIVAVVVGPIVAVRLTRFLDEQREIRGRKLWIYKTLMATRAYTLSAQHVEALNRIDLEFNPNVTAERQVLSIWRQYLDLLGDRNIPQEQWGLRRIDLLVELLYQMGKNLGYDYDKTEIKNGTYAPVAHGRLEEQQEEIRQGAIEVLQGKREIKIFVATSPSNNTPGAPSGFAASASPVAIEGQSQQ